MNLTLTRRGDYVLRAALYLAEAWDAGSLSKIREVSRGMKLPATYTPQVLGLLARAGLARGKAGPAGGYRLTRDPSTISVLEVVEAAEGPRLLTTCILRGGPCHWNAACAIHSTWAGASEAFRGSLAATSLADLAAEDARLGRRGTVRSGGG